MHCILSPDLNAPAGLEATVFDLASLLGRLQTLADRRCPKGRRYSLAPVLLLIILAKLAGEDKPHAIADWISSRPVAAPSPGPTLAADAPSQHLSAHSGPGG